MEQRPPMYADISCDQMRAAVDPRYWLAQTAWPVGALVMVKLTGEERVEKYALTELDVPGAKRAQQVLLSLVEHRWLSRVDIVDSGWTAQRQKAERGNLLTLTLKTEAGNAVEQLEVWYENVG